MNERTIITSPTVDVVHAEIEFHIADGEVKFALVRCKDTLKVRDAEAIAKCIAVANGQGRES